MVDDDPIAQTNTLPPLGSPEWHFVPNQECEPDTELRRWAFEHAQQIAGPHALAEDVIESADAINAWVSKKDRTND